MEYHSSNESLNDNKRTKKTNNQYYLISKNNHDELVSNYNKDEIKKGIFVDNSAKLVTNISKIVFER